MAKPGPKPRPTALKLLEGNAGRHPINYNEPVIDGAPEKPHSVSVDAFASAEWDRLLRAMPPSVYTAVDSAVICEYALAWSMLLRSQNELDTHGLMIEEPIVHRGEVVAYVRKLNPAIKAWKAATETLLKTTDRLGLSPGVRSRLSVPAAKDGATVRSKFSGLINH